MGQEGSLHCGATACQRAPLLLVPHGGSHSKHETVRSAESQPHHPGCWYQTQSVNKKDSKVSFCKAQSSSLSRLGAEQHHAITL